MVMYRRNRELGGTYFFTVTLADRSSMLLVDRIDDLRAAYKKVSSKYPFETRAIVILPEHLHTVWTLPEGDANYSLRWQLIKTHFSRAIKLQHVWQARFWERTIRDERDLRYHIEYVHNNPLKHMLTERAEDWPYSSIHRMADS
jgi:putative transposase